jgi:hypothetical protein
VPFGNRESPRADLLRRELREAHLTERGGRLPEQPAELRDRDAFTLVPVQVLLDPLAEHQRVRAAAGQEPGKLVLKRPLRVSLGREPSHLSSLRAATCDPVPVRPQRLAVRALRLQLEHLALLNHHVNLLDRLRDPEITASAAHARDLDHPSHTEVDFRAQRSR